MCRRYLFCLRLQVKYIHNWVLTVLCYLVVSFTIFSSSVSAENTAAAADGFLKQLLGAEHYGMGGSFAGTTRGANAVSNNPAGIACRDEPIGYSHNPLSTDNRTRI